MSTEEQLIQVLKENSHSIARAVAEVNALRSDGERRLQQGCQQHLAAARSRCEAVRAAAAQAYRQARDRAQRELQQVEQGAGLWAAPWQSPRWQSYAPATGSAALVRLGQHILPGRNSNLSVPVLLPFAGGRNLVIEAPGPARDRAVAAARSYILRLLATLPPGQLRLLLIDPVGLGESVAAFMHLVEYLPELVTGKVWVEPADIDKQLANLSAHMETVIQSYLRSHYRTMEEYNAEAGEVAEPYRLLVVVDFPANFSADAGRRLISIAQNGPRCGVFTLLLVDSSRELPRGLQLDDLRRAATVVRADGDAFRLEEPDFAEVQVELDAPPPQARFEALLHTIGAAVRTANTVEVAFDRLIPAPAQWWQGDATASLAAPIGRAGARATQRFELGVGTAQHALVAGRTGSGKSTLLHVLIAGLALTYSPEELELYLIDFKKGVEFKDYASFGLPHARVVAIEGEREFGLSVLQALDAELQRRGELFRTAGAGSLAEYRAQGRRLPRILLLVDEFQEFFAADDALARQAGQFLDRLTRQGRAFGIHILLGSQSLHGAWTLARSTMDQMAVRIALQCSEADSRLILSDDNPAARLLTRPGEAFYNPMSGLKEGNSRFQIAWLSESQRRQYLQQLQERALAANAACRRPVVFEGNAPARLDSRADHPLRQALAQPGRPAPRSVPAWLGEPVALKAPTAVTFARRRGRNLLIVGRDEALATGVFFTALVSLGVQLPAGQARAYVCDLTVAGSEDSSALDALAAGLPPFVQPVAPRRLLPTVAALAEEVQQRLQAENVSGPSIWLALLGLHRARDLRRDEERLRLRRPGEPPTPTEQLALILKEGPEVGVHVLTWCDVMAALEPAVDRRTLGEFGLRVALPMTEKESMDLLSNAAAGRLAPFRALCYDDEQSGQLEKFRPYERPDPDWLRQAAARLAGH